MNAKKMTQEERDAALERFDNYASKTSNQYDFGFGTGGPLRERNREKLANWSLNCPEMKEFRGRVKAKVNFDPLTETDRFPAFKESFNWKKFRQQIDSELKEADSGTMYPLFLVAGVLQNVIGMYNVAKPSYQDWVTVTPTKLIDTPVAPLHGMSFPREVGEQMPYPVAKTAAMSLKFHARKYGTMLELTHELIEDDQTGQFKMLSGTMGEYLQLVTEVLVYGRLASVGGMSYSGFAPGVSETMPSGESAGHWPWTTSAATLIGGGFNQASSFGAPTVSNLEAGMIALNQQKNLLGIVMPVNTNRIIVSPKYMFDIAVVLNSAYYPAVGGSAGTTGTSFAINPLKGIADATISRFLFDNTGNAANSSTAWYIVDDSKPWFQLIMREPVSVVQETPTSGQSFERDVVRFKCSTRMIADHVDPRFAWQGNDGSV